MLLRRSTLTFALLMTGIIGTWAQDNDTTANLTTATGHHDLVAFSRELSSSHREEGLLPFNLSDSLSPTGITNYDEVDRLRISADSTLQASPQIAVPKALTWRPNSSRALLWAILPGGGQIYNRKYWKVPLVWAALGSCFYAFQWNQRMYRDYHAAYRDLSSENPAINTAWLAFAPKGTVATDYEKFSALKGTLKRGNDYYRRYRDISIVAGVLVYALSMLDAYVDAELYTFDISPDLSLRLQPQVSLPSATMPYNMGINCSLTF